MLRPAAAWVERHREEVCALLTQHTGLSSIAWRPALDMLKEEGCAPGGAVPAAEGDAEDGGEDAAAAVAAAPAPSGGAAGADVPPEVAVVCENGLRYAAALWGQKTGFYADQRDNRALVRQLAAGRNMLDLYCYSGGFALSAAAGGATAALGVDSSGTAVELAGRNAALNGLEGVASFLRADAADFMKEVRAWGVLSRPGPSPLQARRAGLLFGSLLYVRREGHTRPAGRTRAAPTAHGPAPPLTPPSWPARPAGGGRQAALGPGGAGPS